MELLQEESEDEQPVKKLKTETTAVPVKAQKSEGAEEGGVCIFMKNLPWKASEDDIAEWFGDCGEVTAVRLGQFIPQCFSLGFHLTRIGYYKFSCSPLKVMFFTAQTNRFN